MSYEPIFFDIETTGFDPMDKPYWMNAEGCRVTAIGIGTYEQGWREEDSPEDVEANVAVYMDSDEYVMLDNVCGRDGYVSEMVESIRENDRMPFLVGWNSRMFDHPFIACRCGRYRLSAYPFMHSVERLDAMRPAAGTKGKTYISEDDYLDILGIEDDDEYDGSDMPEAFENNNWSAIKAHCESDVEQMAEMFFIKREMFYEHFYEHYNIDADPTFGGEVEF